MAYSTFPHEIAHGNAPLLFGGETAKVNERLTLDPIPPIDPVGMSSR